MRGISYLVFPLLGISYLLFGAPSQPNNQKPESSTTKTRAQGRSTTPSDPIHDRISQYGPITSVVLPSSYTFTPQSFHLNNNWNSRSSDQPYTVNVYGLQNWLDQPDDSVNNINNQFSENSNLSTALSPAHTLAANTTSTSLTLYPRSNFGNYAYVVFRVVGDTIGDAETQPMTDPGTSTMLAFIKPTFAGVQVAGGAPTALLPKFANVAQPQLDFNIQSQYGPITSPALTQSSIGVFQRGTITFFVDAPDHVDVTVSEDSLVNPQNPYSVGPDTGSVPVTFSSPGTKRVKLECEGQTIYVTVVVDPQIANRRSR